MGNFMSGGYLRGSRPKSKCVREFSLILDAPDLVKRSLIRPDKRRIIPLQMVCGGQYAHLISGKIDDECGDTFPLWHQTGTRHRMELGVAELEYRFCGRDPIRYKIVLIAGLTRLEIVHWVSSVTNASATLASCSFPRTTSQAPGPVQGLDRGPPGRHRAAPLVGRKRIR